MTQVYCIYCNDTLSHPDDPTGQADCGYCGGSFGDNPAAIALRESLRSVPLVVRLRNGRYVFAKMRDGELRAVQYGNRTAAHKKANELGSGWAVVQSGRPFYVGRFDA